MTQKLEGKKIKHLKKHSRTWAHRETSSARLIPKEVARALEYRQPLVFYASTPSLVAFGVVLGML
jgi:hypothetical protein